MAEENDRDIRVIHSNKNEIDILTFYEDELSFGNMAIACSARIQTTKLTLHHVRDFLPKKEELWWDKIGVEIRGGGVRIFFSDNYQEAVQPDVLRIANLVWGSPLLLGGQLCGNEEVQRSHAKYIEKWAEEYYSAARQH